MKVLRDIREVAELWLCERFIPAFHLVFGWPHRTGPTYKAIRRVGALLPAAEVGRFGLFVLDVLAEDDQYNFLVAGGYPMGAPGPTCYGFVFDAERLIEQGALLGTGDLLPKYARVAWEIAQAEGFDPDQINMLGRTKFSPEAMHKFVDYESGRSWGEGGRKLLHDYMPAMIKAFRDIQSKHRFAGTEAFSKLYAWAEPVCTRIREALELSASYMRGENFAEHYASIREHFPHWGKGQACKSAARDTYYFRHHELLPWPLRDPPEILWRGRLPLGKAVAAFELPCWTNDALHGALNWPDDIFSLLCPR